MSISNRIAMVGGGSWGTALVKLLNENQQPVSWWLRDKDAVANLQAKHHNPRYLSSVTFSSQLIDVTDDLKRVVSENEIIFLAVPAAFLKKTLSVLSPGDFTNKTIVSAIKGMIPVITRSSPNFSAST
jgi:glycerol-3-phosphate dehydrogenase (NAD(P)+)